MGATGLPAWQSSQPGQVGNQAALTVESVPGSRLVTLLFASCWQSMTYNGMGMATRRFCVTFCVTFLAPLPMSTPTGLFERNGHFYLRFIIPTHQRHLFGGRTRIVQSLNTNQRRQAVLSATLVRAEIMSKLLSQGHGSPN